MKNQALYTQLNIPDTLPPDLKLLLFDIDGTLIDSGGEVPIDLMQTLKELQSRGVLLGLCSGRPNFAAKELLATELFQGPSMFFSGALLCPFEGDGSKVLSSLQKELVRDLIDFAAERHWHLELYTQENYFCSNDSPFREIHKHYIGSPPVIADLHSLARSEEILKANILCEVDSESEVLEALDASELTFQFSPARGAAHPTVSFINVNSEELSKSQAIRQLLVEASIERSRLGGFGDSDSDFALLAVSGFAVQVGNTSEKLVTKAHFQTPDLENGGPTALLRDYFLSTSTN